MEFFPCHSQLNNYNYGHTFLKASDFTERQKSWGLVLRSQSVCLPPLPVSNQDSLLEHAPFVLPGPLPTICPWAWLPVLCPYISCLESLKQQQFWPKRWRCWCVGGDLQGCWWCSAAWYLASVPQGLEKPH